MGWIVRCVYWRKQAIWLTKGAGKYRKNWEGFNLEHISLSRKSTRAKILNLGLFFTAASKRLGPAVMIPYGIVHHWNAYQSTVCATGKKTVRMARTNQILNATENFRSV